MTVDDYKSSPAYETTTKNEKHFNKSMNDSDDESHNGGGQTRCAHQ